MGYRSYFSIFDPATPVGAPDRAGGDTDSAWSASATLAPPQLRRIEVVYLSSRTAQPRHYCYETDLPVRIGDLVQVPDTELSRRFAPGEPNIARVVSLNSDYHDGPVQSVLGIWQQARA